MNIRFSESSFFYRYFIFLVILMYMLEATSWSDFNDSFLHDLLQILSMIFALLYIMSRRFTLKELFRLVIFNSVGLLCFISSGFTGLFMTMLAITLFPKNHLDEILKMILKEETTIFILIVLLSLFGVLDNKGMDINKGEYIANAVSLGFNHPNMLAAQGTSIILLFLCVYRNKLKFKYIFCSYIGVLTLFFFSRGRIALLLGVVSILLITTHRYYKDISKPLFKVLPWIYCIVLTVLSSFIMIYAKLGENSSIARTINDGIFNGRIGLAYRSLLVYRITLFGKPIDTSYWNEYQYFSLDNGQIMILLEFGIIGFLAYFFVIQQTLNTIKNEKEVIFGIVMSVFLIWSMYEGTMYFIGKNFALLFLGSSNYLMKIDNSSKGGIK